MAGSSREQCLVGWTCREIHACRREINPSPSKAGFGACSLVGAAKELVSLWAGVIPGGVGIAEVFAITFGRSGRGLVVALVDVSAGCPGHPLPTAAAGQPPSPRPKAILAAPAARAERWRGGRGRGDCEGPLRSGAVLPEMKIS